MSDAHHPEATVSDDAFLAESRRLLSVFPAAMGAFGAALMFILCYIAVTMA